MRQYLNFSLLITIICILGIVFSESIMGDFIGKPYTDFAIFAVGIIIALVSCLITSNFSIYHSTKSMCFWDCTTDVISILIHLIGTILWFYYGEYIFPKGFISLLEFQLVFWLMIVMIVIAFVEFLITLNNCLESMLRNGSVKVNN